MAIARELQRPGLVAWQAMLQAAVLFGVAAVGFWVSPVREPTDSRYSAPPVWRRGGGLERPVRPGVELARR